MKNKRKWEKQTNELFRDALASRGFFYSAVDDGRFIRLRGRVEQHIAFPGHWDDLTDGYVFHALVANKYLNLEQMFPAPDDDRIVPRVVCPSNLFIGSNAEESWRLESSGTLTVAMEFIDQHAIPYLDRYADLEILRKQLESNSPRDEIVFNSYGKPCLLAAVLAFQGKWNEAMRVVDQAIDERKNKMLKYRRHLEQLREYLIRSRPVTG